MIDKALRKIVFIYFRFVDEYYFSIATLVTGQLLDKSSRFVIQPLYVSMKKSDNFNINSGV